MSSPLCLSDKRISIIITTVLLLYIMVGMGIDLISPSLPAISHDLTISETWSKDLIAVYLAGFALGNFFIGFLSDAWGRRKLMIAGLMVFTLASLMAAVYANASVLVCVRFLQGFSIAASLIVARAMLSDILLPEKLIRIAPIMATVWGLGPVIGPMIGGYLQYYFSWHVSFLFFAGYGFVLALMTIVFLPETHFNRQSLKIKQIKTNIAAILSNQFYIGLIVIMGVSYSMLITFNVLGPFLIQTVLGHSSIYFGRVAFCTGLMFLLGTVICRQWVKNYPVEKILLVSLLSFLGIALTGLFFAYGYKDNIWATIVPTLLIFLCCGIIYPACLGKTLAIFRHLAGSSSAITNLTCVSITAFTTVLLSFIQVKSAVTIAVIYVVLMMISVLLYWLVVSESKEEMSKEGGLLKLPD